MKSDLTKEQAVLLANSGWWKELAPKQIVEFQLFENRLCMPFGDFLAAVSKVFGAEISDTALARHKDSFRKEFLAGRAAPTFEERMQIIPSEQRRRVLGGAALVRMMRGER